MAALSATFTDPFDFIAFKVEVLRARGRKVFKGTDPKDGRKGAGEHFPPSGPTLKGADPRIR